MGLVLRQSRRHYARHPWQLGLCVLGIALGVAIVLAIDLANRSAERAFVWAAQTVAGRSTHSVQATGPGGVDEGLYAELRRGGGVGELAPVVEGMVRLQRDGLEFVRGSAGGILGTGAEAPDVERFDLRVLGIDPLAEAPLRPWMAWGRGGVDLPLGRWMTEPGAFVVSASTAARLGLEPDRPLPLRVQGRWVQGVMIGVLEPADPVARRGLDQVMLVDIATAQEWFDKRGRIDRLDARCVEGEAEALERALPASLEVVPVGAASGTLSRLTAAFRTNLSALSLLALVVGAFLIYNTLRFAVVQRRTQLGILRALGVTRREMFGLVMIEAAILGAVGVGLGILLGVGLASQLVGLVVQTINDLYATVAVDSVAVTGDALLRAACLGLGACLVAAFAPAWEATSSQPRDVLVRSTLERRARANVRRAVVLALLCGLGAWALLSWDERSIVPAYGGLLLILLAAAALTPISCLGFLAAVRRPVAALLGVAGSLAARGAAAGLSRTSVAVAALMLAVATTVGLGTMIQGFRGSVAGWLEAALVRDVYITVPAVVSDRQSAVLDPAVAAALEAAPEVEGFIRYRRANVAFSARVPDGDDALEDGAQEVLAVAYGPSWAGGRGFEAFEFLDGDDASTRARIASEPDLVWVSEPFAYRHGVARGQRIHLRAAAGWQAFEVAGVFRDYGSEQGIVMMHRRLSWLPRFGDEAMSSLALDGSGRGGADSLVERLRAVAIAAGGEDPQQLSIQSSRGLREASLEVFDRTFAVTTALRGLCLIVAFLGIFSALMALQWERRREVATLRAIGALPRQVAVLVLTQTGLLGLCAGLLAVPVGAALGQVLAHAINKRSFGWTLVDVSLPWGVALEAVLLALGAALLAGAWPAWRLGRAAVTPGLRVE